MSSEGVKVDRLVSVYRKIKAAIEEKEAAHKQEIAELTAHLNVVSEKLLEICNTQNVDSLRTAEGTVIRRAVTRFWTSDWDAMHKFILEHDAPYLLEQRIHNSNMKQFLEENPDTVPMGLNADTKYVISVRKPSNK